MFLWVTPRGIEAYSFSAGFPSRGLDKGEPFRFPVAKQAVALLVFKNQNF